jgi:hypothetical protein
MVARGWFYKINTCHLKAVKNRYPNQLVIAIRLFGGEATSARRSQARFTPVLPKKQVKTGVFQIAIF